MRRLTIYGIFLINLVLIIYLWWTGSGNLFYSTNAGSGLIALGRLSGLIAEYFILVQLVLIGRVKFVEQEFGHDKLNRAHRWLGFGTLGLIIAHPVLLTIGYSAQNRTPFISQFVNFLTSWQDVAKAAAAVIIFLAVIAISVTIIRRRLRYETWYFIHLVLYVAIILALDHQTKTADVSFGGPLYYWLTLNYLVFGLIILYRFLRPFYNFYRHRFQVQKVVAETHDVYSVYITGRELEKFKFEPGQFVNITFLSRGKWFTHPFSFSSAPNGRYLRLSIKKSGDFTNQISQIQPGTYVILDGPLGIFTGRETTKENFLLIAGGIGITPIRALAEKLAAEKKDFTVLFANKTEEDIVFKNELEQLVPPGRLYNILSQSESAGFEHGRVDAEKLNRLVPDFKDREVYLCGPVPMLMAVRQTLLEQGLPSSQLHYELFSY